MSKGKKRSGARRGRRLVLRAGQKARGDTVIVTENDSKTAGSLVEFLSNGSQGQPLAVWNDRVALG